MTGGYCCDDGECVRVFVAAPCHCEAGGWPGVFWCVTVWRCGNWTHGGVDAG